jgi:D-glycero-D-manno-heptose 1,7-bisphosphate phosphatase
VLEIESGALSETVRTVFLDRDGVINEKRPEGKYVTNSEELVILPGVIDAIHRLNQQQMQVIVVSNQRGIALGLYTIADVNAIHNRLQHDLLSRGAKVDAFFFCPHDKRQCDCRKPATGLFDQAKAQFPSITGPTSVIVGDSLSDIQFGVALRMRTVFIDSGVNQKPGAELARSLADWCCRSLAEAVYWLLGSAAATQ